MLSIFIFYVIRFSFTSPLQISPFCNLYTVTKCPLQLFCNAEGEIPKRKKYDIDSSEFMTCDSRGRHRVLNNDYKYRL